MSKKKSKAEKAEPLSKKERKKLEEREAKLAAELAARAAEKAAKKSKKKKWAAPNGDPSFVPEGESDPTFIPAKKKGKGKKEKAAPHPMTKAERDALRPTPEPAAAEPQNDFTPEERIAAADRVLAEGGADSAMDQARKTKVRAKQELRELGEKTLAELDRSDAAAVSAYNERFGLVTGTFATDEDTKKKMAKRLAGPDVPAGDLKLEAALGGAAKVKDLDALVKAAEEGDPVAVAAIGPFATAELPDGTVIGDGETIATFPVQVAEVVETETGSIIAVGSEKTDEPVVFAKPSDAAPELEEGRNGYKIAVLEEDGTVARKRDGSFKTVRQFTRVTSYIGVLEDKTNLEKWKLRKLLEGVALNEEAVGTAEREAGADGSFDATVLFTSLVRDAVHNRDVAIAKARKADRKGKLEVGELGERIEAADKAFKDRLNGIAEEALELGGVHEAANKGTDIHALCDIYDTEGMPAVNDLLKEEKISPADHADVVAYATAMSEAGIKVLESEVVVVHDALKRAGRLDRIVLAKMPGMQRAVRMVADIKTGNVDYGQAKLAQQLEAYASSKGYDLETGERRDLKLSRKVGLVIHLPQGKAKASIHPVDLTIGARGNKLAGEVRAFRNEGRNAVDFSIDLAKGDES